MRRPFALMTAAAVTAGGLSLMPPASPATIEAGSSAAQPTNIQRTEVCFTVHNVGDPVDQQVSGTLFHDQENYTGGGTALLLQHGGVSDRSVWDGGRPRVTGAVSMVDLLAQAGYVVFAIDRLGNGRSPYLNAMGEQDPGSGWTLTLDSNVEMTHEMVTQIRSGTYRVTTDTCASGATTGPPASRVVLMGHSLGASIVESYATRYHDIDGIVPMGSSNCCSGNTFFREVVVGTLAPQLAMGNDYVYLFEADENGYSQQCEKFAFYTDGVSQDVVAQVCGPEGFGGKPKGPSGEFATGATISPEIIATMGNVGPTPALLVFGDKDLFFPNARPGDDDPDSDTITPEMEYWTTNPGCNCDVEFLWQRNSSHANTFHDSAAELTADVIEWLRSRGL